MWGTSKASPRKGAAKGPVSRRQPQFWSGLNVWLRSILDERGSRPSVEELQAWYDENCDTLWGDEKPTFKETKDHAKCLRPKEALKNYFRDYRAKRATVRKTAASALGDDGRTDSGATQDTDDGHDVDVLQLIASHNARVLGSGSSAGGGAGGSAFTASAQQSLAFGMRSRDTSGADGLATSAMLHERRMSVHTAAASADHHHAGGAASTNGGLERNGSSGGTDPSTEYVAQQRQVQSYNGEGAPFGGSGPLAGNVVTSGSGDGGLDWQRRLAAVRLQSREATPTSTSPQASAPSLHPDAAHAGQAQHGSAAGSLNGEHDLLSAYDLTRRANSFDPSVRCAGGSLGGGGGGGGGLRPFHRVINDFRVGASAADPMGLGGHGHGSGPGSLQGSRLKAGSSMFEGSPWATTAHQLGGALDLSSRGEQQQQQAAHNGWQLGGDSVPQQAAPVGHQGMGHAAPRPMSNTDLADVFDSKGWMDEDVDGGDSDADMQQPAGCPRVSSQGGNLISTEGVYGQGGDEWRQVGIGGGGAPICEGVEEGWAGRGGQQPCGRKEKQLSGLPLLGEVCPQLPGALSGGARPWAQGP